MGPAVRIVGAPQHSRAALVVPFTARTLLPGDGSARRSLCVYGGPERMTHELTEERIAQAMARAERVACRPLSARCYVLP
jgi:hypothetical protein